MFHLFKSKKKAFIPDTESITLQLTGLHCSSCAVNIDLALEDLPGVIAKTNYAKSETRITFDPSQTTLDQIHFTIRDLGYGIA
jgi:copper chaperone CopZ